MPFEASSGMLAQHFSRAAVDPERPLAQAHKVHKRKQDILLALLFRLWRVP